MKFEVGKKYKVRSICDSECFFTYEITKISKGFVTVSSRMDGAKRKKIFVDDDGIQFCYPQGTYSMCPILKADKVAE